MEQPTVGGWTQAWCTTCKQMREHIVVAMVGTKPAKVECTSCHKQHLFKAGPPGTKEPKEPKSATARTTGARARKAAAASEEPAAQAIDLEARIAARPAQKYDPMHRYNVDDVVEHPSFGVGVVLALPGAQRAEVYFQSGKKLLLHDRGGKTPGLVRPPPRDEEAGPRVSDAPPKTSASRSKTDAADTE